MPERHVRALAEHGPRYLLDVPMEGAGTMVDPGYRLDPVVAFGRNAPLVVEIGSGGGDCVVHAAQEHPDWDFLAIEVWGPGVAHTIAKAGPLGLSNIRLIQADAAQALDFILPPASAHEVWTFFPDPWPKLKHHKRRLVQPAFAATVARLLEAGGAWRIATDWADYAWHIRTIVEQAPGFTNPYAGRAAHPGDAAHDPEGRRGGFAPRFDGRVPTRFERKGERNGRPVWDVLVTRNSTDG
ncbi:tRNA (guanosine(46)-N7)-methyltransferase TrmB [Leekyejoonella antrihumi]|uniref:tRNA (guanine-N(7)-)-methyltransferase n=2 Tax=Leekyejoonella antrihumi TaxID=1660198 RepID=A0A563DVC0_9MICO|nr:tRNA (guanosine(46)-N7)-methyltransferase TrmB [Leekyejoonella antrihumi]